MCQCANDECANELLLDTSYFVLCTFYFVLLVLLLTTNVLRLMSYDSLTISKNSLKIMAVAPQTWLFSILK
jgi:hypothetical protein